MGYKSFNRSQVTEIVRGKYNELYAAWRLAERERKEGRSGEIRIYESTFGDKVMVDHKQYGIDVTRVVFMPIDGLCGHDAGEFFQGWHEAQRTGRRGQTRGQGRQRP